MKAKMKSKLNLEKRVPLQEVIPLSTPFLIYIDPSSMCNFQCKFCPSGHKDLIKRTGYSKKVMGLDLFKKIIRDLNQFDNPIKVLRMNKIGEPFLNKNLSEMIACAKKSGCVEYIDLATNGSLLSNDRIVKVIGAGLDRLNISIEGVNDEQYQKFAGIKIKFDALVDTIKWLYAHKGNCEITIKIPGNYTTQKEKKRFLEIFGNYCDRIFIEEIAPIWPFFDIEAYSGISVGKSKGQYKQPLNAKNICTYIFYSMAINADGTVSACCPDWEQKLIIGDVRKQSCKQIWHSPVMNALRRQHLEGRRRENPVCGNCGHIAYCQIDDIDSYQEQVLKKFDVYEKKLSHG